MKAYTPLKQKKNLDSPGQAQRVVDLKKYFKKNTNKPDRSLSLPPPAVPELAPRSLVTSAPKRRQSLGKPIDTPETAAPVLARAFVAHVHRRSRAFTQTNMALKEELKYSKTFETISHLRGRPTVAWEDLTDRKKLTTEGQFGDIYSATLSGHKIIVKTLKNKRPGKNANEQKIRKMKRERAQAKADFVKEMALLTKLWHRNIVHVIGLGTQPELFMVMEFMGGGSLKDLLSAARESQTPLDLDIIIEYAKDCAHGMRYLHEAFPRILHRDLKPANLLISHDRAELKIADFGLSRVMGPNRAKATERYKLTGGTGSLRYMAPEVASSQPYNEKADVYGFGIVLWEMIANKLPYKALNHKTFYNAVVNNRIRPPIGSGWPASVTHLITSCWDHDPDKRPTFRQIIPQLEALAQSDWVRRGSSSSTASGCCTII